MNRVTYPVWSCPKKLEAREQSIILTYRSLLDRKSIPENKQYWTMCGSYDDHNGNPIEGEFHQLKKEGLITTSQFNGVDIDADIIEKNSEHYSDLQWYCGDFLQVMKESAIKGTYNPAIVNCDNVRLPKAGIQYLVSLLLFLENNAQDVMVVSNIMLNHPRQKSVVSNGNEMIEILYSYYDLRGVWDLLPYCYEYKGTGKQSRTWMGSLIFVKNSS